MLRPVLALVAIATLAACAVATETDTATLRLSPAESGAAVAAAETELELAPARRAAGGQAEPALVAAAPAAYVAVDADPERLIGLSVGEAAELLGRPALVRREPPAEVWQYAGRECVLHLFLYDNEGGGSSVTHYEMRGLDGISPQACLAAHLQTLARGG